MSKHLSRNSYTQVKSINFILTHLYMVPFPNSVSATSSSYWDRQKYIYLYSSGNPVPSEQTIYQISGFIYLFILSPILNLISGAVSGPAAS